MKYLSTLILSFLLLTSYAHTAHKKDKTKDEKQSIEELIKEIKNDPTNRRIAINRLKIRLRTINSDIRRKIMLDLQHSLGGHIIQTNHTSSGQMQVQSGTTHQQTPVKQSTPSQTSVPSQTSTPSSLPTSTPAHTSVPTSTPTAVPTHTSVPTSTPTTVPTHTSVPTSTPTAVPTHTSVPTSTPTAVPTHTSVPTSTPTAVPTHTSVPTSRPHRKRALF